MVKFGPHDPDYKIVLERLRGLVRRAIAPRCKAHFIVPYLQNKLFVDRPDLLAEIQDHIGTGGKSVSLCALNGLGGIGKTQLAIEYAYQTFKARPYESVFWIQATTIDRVRQSFTEIAHTCKVPGRNDPEVDIMACVSQWLKKEKNGRWLMVIDNADDMDIFFEKQSSLVQYIPEVEHGSVLITTRDSRIGERLSRGRRPINVSTMSREKCHRLLRNHLQGTVASTEELDALSDRLERLPLALAQASSFMKMNKCSAQEYINLLDESLEDAAELLGQDFQAHGRDGPDEERPRAVTETWIVSFLQIKRQDPLAASLLSFMSWLDRQNIPNNLLQRYQKRWHEEEGWKPSKVELMKSIGALKAFSLVAADAETDGGLTLHRLVQIVTRKWLQLKEGTAQQYAGRALLVMEDVYFNVPDRHQKLHQLQNYAPSVLSVLQSDTPQAFTVNKVSLYTTLGTDYVLLGKFYDGERLLRTSVEIAEACLSNSHRETIIPVLKLSIVQLNHGARHTDESKKLPLYKEAELMMLRLLEVFQRRGERHTEKSKMIQAMLSTNYRWEGRFEDAMRAATELVRMTKEIYGEDPFKLAGAIQQVAHAHLALNDYDKAERLYQELLEAARKVDATANFRTLGCEWSLSNLYSRQGRWKDAEELFLPTWVETKSLFDAGKVHSNTDDTLRFMADIQWNLGKAESAIENMEACVQAQEIIYGTDDYRVHETALKLADMRIELNRRFSNQSHIAEEDKRKNEDVEEPHQRKRQRTT